MKDERAVFDSQSPSTVLYTLADLKQFDSIKLLCLDVARESLREAKFTNHFLDLVIKGALKKATAEVATECLKDQIQQDLLLNTWLEKALHEVLVLELNKLTKEDNYDIFNEQ